MVKSMGYDVSLKFTQPTVEYESTSQGLLRPKSMYYERYDHTFWIESLYKKNRRIF